MSLGFQRSTPSFRNHAPRRCAGDALIESCLVVAVLCVVLFGLLQVSQLYAAREILDHAAVAAARARTVGFNDFMVRKVARVAAIPNAGRILEPQVDTTSRPSSYWTDTRPGDLIDDALRASPSSPQFALEWSRIPLYLGAPHAGWLPAILDYEDWDTIRDSEAPASAGSMLRAVTRQAYPLRFPFHRVFYADDTVALEATATMESHYPLYLE